MMNEITRLNEKMASQGEAQHVLVVDDEEHVGLFIEVVLSSQGYEVTRYIDSKKALSHFVDNPQAFDFVITDQNMPKMSGTELVKNILRIQPDLTIILCVGYSPELDEKTVRTMGVSAYLPKPLSANDLLVAIDECVSV